MAKLKNGIFGPISGKLGPVVGGVWNGIPYLRTAPKVKKKPAVRSEAQIANEQKMKFLNEVLVPFHPFINIGFQNLAQGKTAISAAYSLNFHQAVTGRYPNLGVDYSKLIISKGALPGLNSPVMALTSADVIEITWQNSDSNMATYNDQLMFVVYSPHLDFSDGFVGAALRRDLHCSFRLDPRLIGTPLEVYIGLTSHNRKKISNSIYLGQIKP